ncbi:hypothetical protein CPT06_13955 [Bacillus vallismortis]|nr:hypothetical protein CPT06_13955 [Bacillus vallismortis]
MYEKVCADFLIAIVSIMPINALVIGNGSNAKTECTTC